MPQPQKPYMPRLQGYAMPIIVKALETVGPPAEIAAISPEQQGPMLVTLASELTAVVTELILMTLRDGRFQQQFDDLRRKHGGSAYQKLLSNLRKHTSIKNTLWGQLDALLRCIISSDLGSETWDASAKGNKTPVIPTGFILWNPLPSRRKEVTKMKAAYQRLALAYQAAHKKVDQLKANEQKECASIEQSEVFQNEKRSIMMRIENRLFAEGKEDLAVCAIRADFSTTTAITAGGAIFYLRNTQPDWWDTFKNNVQQKVEDDTLRAPARLMLRDGMLANSAVKTKTRNLDEATSLVLKEPSKFTLYKWQSYALSPSGIRKWRQELREEDKLVMKWILKNGGKNHPSNPYRAWLHKQGLSPKTTFGFDPRYMYERAANELYWCLSRRMPNEFPFEGIFSTQYTELTWHSHISSRKDREPNYLRHSVR